MTPPDRTRASALPPTPPRPAGRRSEPPTDRLDHEQRPKPTRPAARASRPGRTVAQSLRPADAARHRPTDSTTNSSPPLPGPPTHAAHPNRTITPADPHRTPPTQRPDHQQRPTPTRSAGPRHSLRPRSHSGGLPPGHSGQRASRRHSRLETVKKTSGPPPGIATAPTLDRSRTVGQFPAPHERPADS